MRKTTSIERACSAPLWILGSLLLVLAIALTGVAVAFGAAAYLLLRGSLRQRWR